MAVVITERAGTGGRSIELVGGLKQRVVQVTGDAAYPAGGYLVTPAMFGLTSIIAIADMVNGGTVLHYDTASTKIQFLICGAAAAVLQETAVANQSAITAPMLVIGA